MLLRTLLMISIIMITMNLSGYITYGKGLGDFYYLGMFIFCIGFIGIIHIIIKKYWITIILMIVLLIYNILLLTIYRGSEYPWNGKLFREIMFQT